MAELEDRVREVFARIDACDWDGLASLFADENVPFPLVEALRNLGHDVLRAIEAGRANQGIPDRA